MLISTLFLLPILLGPSLGEDTVAEDVGPHQLERLAELLTARECEDLLAALSRPEEDVLQKLARLSLESNELGLLRRQRRDTDREVHCRPALTDWLRTHGEQTYYDRLSRALQQIGRTDIAIEVSKNINQDKTLSMQRYVEDYHRRVETMASDPAKAHSEEYLHTDTQHSTRQVRDVSWRDLELVVEVEAVPPYPRGVLDGVWPLVYGVLLGFAGALVAAVPVLLVAMHVSRGDRHKLHRLSHHGRRRRPPSKKRSVCVMTSSEMAPLKPTESPGKASSFCSASQLF